MTTTTFTHAEYDRYIADLRARLWTEDWEMKEEQLAALAGVLPASAGMPEASVVTDTEAAFLIGEKLLVATWEDDAAHLTTVLFSLRDVPLTIEWNADWLSAYGDGGTDEVPDHRPMVVVVPGPNGDTYVLPFDAAWHNPVGCINFASRLIEKAHGFRPGIGTGRDALGPKTWKR